MNWDWPGNSTFPAQTGPLPFKTDTKTYYSNARVDYALTQKVRVFGSWLYQYQRQSGSFQPAADSTTGLVNATATSPPEIYAHNLGNTAPNFTTNVGADISITPNLVATVRWGYNFQNYADYGMPTGGAFDNFGASGVGALDNAGVAIPANSQLSQIAGFFSAPNNQNNTAYDATHRHQIDADVAWFKSGWAGTHNFKFGYQLMRLSNAVDQHFNEPEVVVYPGQGQVVPNYTGPTYDKNCAKEVALYGDCEGRYGYINIVDYGSLGRATSMNHAFFVQDAWTVGHGLTINAGVRIENEYLPAEDQPAGGISKPIQFGWGDKISPRLGAAWDPSATANGRYSAATVSSMTS